MYKMIDDYLECMILINRRILEINAFLRKETNRKRYENLSERKAVLLAESKELASSVNEMKKNLLCGDVYVKTDTCYTI